jgi:uncharacterized membrane protein YedE/YeeE
MTAPLIFTDVIPADCSLWLAGVIGIGMGFFLERAGFGSAKKLAAQFYLYDMAVFKVMGTAVLTAMVGIYLLSATCFLDLGNVTFVGTFVWPQVVGGLILGIGFVVGGYCPGTSLVACATGKLDGMVFAGGLIAGMLSMAGCIRRFNVLRISPHWESRPSTGFSASPMVLRCCLSLFWPRGAFWQQPASKRGMPT